MAPSVSPELIRIAARQVRVWRGGSGPNLLLVHGGLGDARWHWHTVWNELASTFAVAAPDLPHFGGTVALPHGSFADRIEWLARVQELLGMSPAFVVGNSFGASLARLFAAAHLERVSRLALADGGQLTRLPQIARRVVHSPLGPAFLNFIRRAAFSERGIRRAFTNQALVTPEVLEASRSAAPGFVSLMQQAVLGELPAAQTPRMPTRLVWGEQDRLVPFSRARELAAEIPNVELAVIKHAGHLPQLEDPLSFVRILTDFGGRA